MLPYFKKYVIVMCVVAAAMPVLLSTFYAATTGTILASSLAGTVSLIAVFFGALFIMGGIMSRKADAEVDRMIALYNEECDPEAFLVASESLARSISAPYPEPGAWFMSYYAQALLDVGRTDQALAIRRDIEKSVELFGKPLMQASIIISLIPLLIKTSTPAETLPVVERGIELLKGVSARGTRARMDFLLSHYSVLQKTIDGNIDKLIEFREKAVGDPAYFMRVRVEFAWEEAQLHFARQDAEEERRCLQFVADHGNKLALVKLARARLAQIRPLASA